LGARNGSSKSKGKPRQSYTGWQHKDEKK